MEADEIEKLAARTVGALEEGNYLRALALADQLVEAVPDNGLFRCWRAYALFDSRQAEEAYKEAVEAAKLAPELPEVWFVQAISAALLGRSCEAQAAFEKAVGASRNDPRVLAEYANFMATERGPKPAEEVAIRAVRAAPNGPEGWAALGLAQLRLGLKAEAESSLKRALELDPNNARAQVYMGKFLYDAGRENEAAAIAKLMQDTPGLEDLADQLAEAVRARRTAAMLARRRQFAEALAGRAGKYKNFRWLKVVLVIAAAAAAALAVLLSLRRI